MSEQNNKTGNLRRQYPRRALARKIGVMCGGHFFIAESREIGEGGLSFSSEFVLNEGDEVVISMQIPHGDFISVRAHIGKPQKKDSSGLVVHGVIFKNIEFAHKRQIRSFVSDRSQSQNSLN